MFPPGPARPLAEPLQVSLAIVFEHVVFPRHAQHGDRQFGQDLLQRVELRRLRQVREIAGVQHERGEFRFRFDLSDRRAQRRRDVGIGRFVESDVGVADLDEAQRVATVCHRRNAGRLPQR